MLRAARNFPTSDYAFSSHHGMSTLMSLVILSYGFTRSTDRIRATHVTECVNRLTMRLDEVASNSLKKLCPVLGSLEVAESSYRPSSDQVCSAAEIAEFREE
jgi:hypothetical protein